MEVNSTRGNALVLMWSIKPMSTFWEDLKGRGPECHFCAALELLSKRLGSLDWADLVCLSLVEGNSSCELKLLSCN